MVRASIAALELTGFCLMFTARLLTLDAPGQVLRAHLAAIFSPDVLPDASGRARRRLPGLPAQLPSGAAALRRQEWLSVVASLPERDDPALFGLPANIGRAAAAAQGAAALAALRRLGFGGGGGGSGSGRSTVDRVLWAGRLAPLLRLWEQLISAAPPAVRTAAAPAAAPAAVPHGQQQAAASAAAGAADAAAAADADGPLGTFVALERSHAAAVVGAIGASLAALQRALDGAGQITPAVQVRLAATVLTGA
jgi:hypothetical protein